MPTLLVFGGRGRTNCYLYFFRLRRPFWCFFLAATVVDSTRIMSAAVGSGTALPHKIGARLLMSCSGVFWPVRRFACVSGKRPQNCEVEVTFAVATSGSHLSVNMVDPCCPLLGMTAVAGHLLISPSCTLPLSQEVCRLLLLPPPLLPSRSRRIAERPLQALWLAPRKRPTACAGTGGRCPCSDGLTCWRACPRPPRSSAIRAMEQAMAAAARTT